MTTISVQAVYHKGALRLKKKLDLPEDALVQVDVTPLETAPVPVSTGSLFGAYPELKAIEQFFLDLLSRRRRLFAIQGMHLERWGKKARR
jgi:predicted DNA-binding antitoxin AbrB/MazE fold protein